MNLVSKIEKAQRTLDGYILRTPLIKSNYLSKMNSGQVYLKLENEQHTGSFKARGALNKVLETPVSDRSTGFITASTGNHGLGFARALQMTGSNGEVYLPENAKFSKVEALKQYNIQTHFHGKDSVAAELHAKKVAKDSGKIWVSPYNDELVIAGQGTIGHEVTEDLDQIDAVLGCVGGGGMMGGVARWFKHKSPQTSIYGCQPGNSAEMSLSIEKGEIVSIDEPVDTLSDGSAGGVEHGAITFELCRDCIDHWLLINENDIAKGIRWMVDKHHKIIEGAASVALMSFINNLQLFEGQTIVIILCGGNIDTGLLTQILSSPPQ